MIVVFSQSVLKCDKKINKLVQNIDIVHVWVIDLEIKFERNNN